VMQSTATSLDADIILQAAEWHTQLQSDDVSDVDRDGFAQWMAADARHATAYVQMEKLWTRFDQVQETPVKHALQAVLKPVRRKRVKAATAAFCLLGVMLAGVMAANTLPVRILLADAHTGIGEQRTLELADHSRVTLDTHTAVNIQFSAGQRHIELLQGNILLQVAKDKQRPFIVETAEGTARALGTQFTVRRQHQATQVMVIESRVEACAVQPRACVTLSPGESTHLQPGMTPRTTLVDPQVEAAWTHFKLVADNMPLPRLLNELQRYHAGHLSFDDSALEGIYVSGVFALNNTTQTLGMLTRTTPVTITPYTPWLTVVRPEK